MALWVPRPKLDSNEEVAFAILANHTQGRRAVGGRLFATNLNLRFVANRLDRHTGGHDFAIPRDEITSVEVAERSAEAFTGGMRRRLRVLTMAGGELFVVNRVEGVADQMRSWACEPAS